MTISNLFWLWVGLCGGTAFGQWIKKDPKWERAAISIASYTVALGIVAVLLLMKRQ